MGRMGEMCGGRERSEEHERLDMDVGDFDMVWGIRWWCVEVIVVVWKS